MRARGFFAMLLLAASVLVASPAMGASGLLTISHLAVGQNSAALFRGPCDEVGLVDAGAGSVDEILLQLDAWGGRETLRWISVSHYDADHLGDVIDVLQASGVSVDAVYDRGGGRDVKNSQTYRDYYDLVTGNGLRSSVDIGAKLGLCSDAVQFSVVSAGTDGTAAGGVAVTEENDRGLCLLVTFDDFDAATCGDVNGTGEGSRSDVETAVAGAFGDVDWVAVNHHGSKYSSNAAYVTTLKAQAGVVSVGKNSYGHPDPAVLNRWRAAGTTLYQTQSGAEGAPVNGNVTVIYAAGATIFRVTPQTGTAADFPLDPQSTEGTVTRLSGSGRVATAVAVSQHVFDQASTAVLATADNYPDALAGAVLAADVAGPLLLTPSDRLDSAVAAELARLHVSTVLLLGGPKSLSESVRTQLAARYSVRRISGSDRYATAVAIANEITDDPARVIIVSGTGFPDAVAASAYAAANGWPIIPVTRDSVPPVVRSYLASHNETAQIIGGPGSISAQTAASLPSTLVGRISGTDRYRTSYAVAQAHLAQGQPSTVWLATGVAFPDALAAGAAVAATGGILLLSPTDTLDLAGDNDPRQLIERNRTCNSTGPLADGIIVGGPRSLSTSVQTALSTILRCSPQPSPAPTPTAQPTPKPTPTPTASPSPTPTPTPKQNCHPAYPDFCIPPPPPDLNCSDFTQKNFRVDHSFGDPHRLDGNKDGIACQS